MNSVKPLVVILQVDFALVQFDKHSVSTFSVSREVESTVAYVVVEYGKCTYPVLNEVCNKDLCEGGRRKGVSDLQDRIERGL